MSITPDYPPDGPSDRGYDSDYGAPPSNATNGLGLALIIIGVINLLLGGYLILNAIALSSMTPDQFHDYMDSSSRNSAFPPPQPIDWRQWKPTVDTGALVWAIVAVVASLVTIVGGLRMRSLRSHGLALTGAILASIPGVSCCCIGGQIVGIWAIVVLLKPEVKSLFR